MISSELIQPHHLTRKAVVYVRQSTRHQVMTNLESQRLQREMQVHATALGWPEERVEIVDGDTGITAATVAGRDHYKNILSEVALNHVGIVISYDSARVSRNCSDWYPLLDICAARRCLIADRDGVYDPSTQNGRLLLGMKGIVSEIELHTLRGRLIAGLQEKAGRGELALVLPTGLVRLEDGRVLKDPNQQVQGAIDLVFKTFLDLRSACKVAQRLQTTAMKIPRRHRNKEIIWREPTAGTIIGILKNPAYAGAFVYGRTHTVRTVEPGGMHGHPQQKRDIKEWSVVVQDRYPSYISWETFIQIRSILSDNRAEYDRNRTRGVPRNGTALLHGITYCGECGHKMVVEYKEYVRYLCTYLRQKQQQSCACQCITAGPIDDYVVKAFFQAISPAELNVYESAMEQRRKGQQLIDTAQKRELQRLRYEADFARRQFDRVDPENRLVASELERRWETALSALRKAEEHIETEIQERNKVVPISIPKDFRVAFESLGRSLPGLWSKPNVLTHAHRKALLRCLIDKVVIHRTSSRDLIHVRIVWRGGAFSESDVPVPVKSLEDLGDFPEFERRLLDLVDSGLSDDEIAKELTDLGFRSPLRTIVLTNTVKCLRLKHRRIRRYTKPRPRRIEGYLTVPQLAEAASVNKYWIYNLIDKGVIEITKDPQKGLYLFPDQDKTIEDIHRLKAGKVNQLSYGRE